MFLDLRKLTGWGGRANSEVIFEDTRERKIGIKDEDLESIFEVRKKNKHK